MSFDCVVAALSPADCWLIGLAVRFGSEGPVFYKAARIGRKGRTFNCYKFRTMVPNADKMKADLEHMNEREGLLFKIEKDPRVTSRLAACLRKYSLDELPQFYNVLRGDMSLVGPRPPIASAKWSSYDLSHLRRLDVLPGITGSVAGGGAAGSILRQLHLAGHGLRGELELLAGPEDSGAYGRRCVQRYRLLGTSCGPGLRVALPLVASKIPADRQMSRQGEARGDALID